MRGGRWRNLRTRLVVLVLLAMIPAWALSLVNARRQRNAAEARARAQSARLAALAAANQDRYVSGARELLTALAHLPTVSPPRSSSCDDLLARMLQDFPSYANLGAADPGGHVFCSAVPLEGPVNLADRSYFQGAVRSRDFSVGEFQIGRITHVASLNFGYPITGPGYSLRGVVFAAVDLDWLSGFASRADLPPGTVLTVLDRDGVVLARYPHPARWVGRSLPGDTMSAFAHGPEGLEVRGIDGVTRLYSAAPLALPPEEGVPAASVAVGIPVEEAFAAAEEELRRNLLVLALVAVAGLLLAWFGADVLLVRPIRALVGATRRLAEGDLSVRSGASEVGGELGELAASFDRMAEALEEGTDALHRSARRLKNLHAIDRAIMTSASPEEVARATLERLRPLLPVDRAAVIELDLGEGVARYLAAFSGNGRDQRTPGTFLLEDLVDPEQIADTRTLHIRDLEEEPELPPFLSDLWALGFRTALVVPLRVDGRTLGWLNLAAVRRDAFGPEHLDIAAEVADQLAIALSQGRLRQELSRRATELEARLDELRTIDAERRRLMARVVDAEERERRRIAEDLHDDSIQVMTAVGMRMGLVRRALADQDDLDRMVELEETVQRAIGRMRRMLFELNPPELEQEGLASALRRYVAEVLPQDLDVRIDNRLRDEPSLRIRTIAYRVAREALTNIRKHASATTVAVTLAAENGGLVVRVQDDGRGFPPEEPDEGPPGHLGLATMRERVEVAGGRLDVSSAPGEGATVELWLPEPSTRAA